MKKIVEKLSKFLKLVNESEQDKEYRFLSQAQTRVQLEVLQRIWDEEHRGSGWK